GQRKRGDVVVWREVMMSKDVSVSENDEAAALPDAASPRPRVPPSPSHRVPASPPLSPAAKFSTHVAWTLATRVLMVGNSVVAGIIVARWLGAEGLGQLAVINVTIATLVQLASFGLPSANTYFIAQDKLQLRAAAMNSLIFALLIGTGLALVLTGVAKLRPEWFGFIPPKLFAIAAISLPFQLLTFIGLNVFLAVGRITQFNLIDLAGQTFVLINAVIALIVMQAGLWVLVSLNTISSVLIGVLLIVLVGFVAARLNNPLPWRTDFPLFRRMLGYGFKFHISILAGALIFRADLLVVNHFRGAAEAGVYSVTSQVALMLMLLPGVIATLLFPRVAAEPDLSGETTCLVSRHTALLLLFCCLAAIPLSYVLPLLYGAAFADVTVQLLILLPGVYLVGIESVLVQHLNAIGLPRTIPLSWIATLIGNIVLVFVLVPRFGARGAAIASTISYALIFFLVAHYFTAQTGRPLSDALLLRGSELRRLLTLRSFRSVRGTL
ncbi:MAG TPA: polysaccharide biosynthesis C-terminal domain-containing protein, partial [Pyrinomonadaceae bacterium]|nr:polysaccharide biosynthesis C-terminal domain-containing protein [Pyrinomonadaceae bacterium]